MSGQVLVYFYPPVNTGGKPIVSYTVIATPGNITATGTKSPVLVTGLSYGVPYTFVVEAMNSVGTGFPSAPSTPITLAAVPNAPTNAVARAGNQQAFVSFTAPNNNGSPITLYTVTSNPGPIVGTGTTSPVAVTGLNNGTAYTFTVTATNANGVSQPSAPSNAVTPSGIPAAPTIGTAAGFNSYATVAFTPGSNNGSPVTQYTAVSIPGSYFGFGASSPITVTGLNNGTSYTFEVSATNANGTSPYSAASNAVTPTASPTVPSPPTSVVATAGNAQASVAFVAPNNGGSAITGYTVTASTGQAASGTASPIIVGGLTNGVAVTFTVTATNGIGTGGASQPSNSVTPATVPSVPVGVSAMAGVLSASVSFSASSGNGSPVTGYTVTSSGGQTASGATSPITVPGLTAETAYTFTVTATNALGTSLPSAPSNTVTPYTVPAAPTAVTATAGAASASVVFTAPDNGGSAITSYAATASTGQTASGASSPITVTGLVNGTAVTFTVTATNIAGTGPASAASNSVTPVDVPTAPLSPSAVAGYTVAVVSFLPPASNNGSAITGYTVTSSGGQTGIGTASPITVTGLTDGTSYTFTVTATNALGTGPSSVTTNAVTPNPTAPSAPLSPSATAGNSSAVVSFTAPASTGGSPIFTYTATASTGQSGVGNSSPITVTGLANGTPVTFTVTATNVNGTSAPSVATAAVTPSTIPAAPTGVVASPGNAQASIAFTAPNNGGSPITLYTATAPPGVVATGASSPIVATGLTNGASYQFVVSATNANGTGPASAPSNTVTPATVPQAPTIGTAVAGNSSAQVYFTPNGNGGSVITGYVVDLNGFAEASGTSSPITVNQLTNGVPYQFSVRAVNSIGISDDSALSNQVTPMVPAGFVIATAYEPGGIVSVSYNSTVAATGSSFTPYTYAVASGSLPPGITLISTTGALTGTPTAAGTYTPGFQATDSSGSYTAPVSVTVGNNNGSGSVQTRGGIATNSTSLVGGAPIVALTTCATYGGQHNGRGLQDTASNSWTNQAYLQGPQYDGINGNIINASQENDIWSCASPAAGSTQFQQWFGTAGYGSNSNTGDQDYQAFLAFQYTNGTLGKFGTWNAQTGTNYAGVPQNTTLVSNSITLGSGDVPCRLYGFCTNLSSLGTNYIAQPIPISGITPGTIATLWNFGSSALTSCYAFWDITVPGTYAASFNQPSSSLNCYQTVAWTVKGPTSAGATTPIKVLPISINGVGVPTAPQNPAVVLPGNTVVQVSFSPPVYTGGAITQYTVTSNPGNLSQTGAASPITVGGLTNGVNYTFTVTATNAVGTGPASVATSPAVAPKAVPGPVSNVLATPGNASATVTYNAPLITGGSAVTGYAATATPGGATANVFSATPQPITVTGLTNGTPYTIGVHAFNAVGTGVPDVSSNSVTPQSTGGTKKQNMLSYLNGLNKGNANRVLTGQTNVFFTGYPGSTSAANANIGPIGTQTTQEPAILGVVMNYVGGNAGAYSVAVMEPLIAAQQSKNGFVQIALYSGVPITNTGTCLDNGADPNGNTPNSTQFHQIATTGTTLNNYWLAQLDIYIAELQKITANGSVVWFKPFIEVNNTQNWYSVQNQTDFTNLWVLTYNYIMQPSKGLQNSLLWVYNVNQDVGNYMAYYPGDAYVDLMSLDMYADNGSSSNPQPFAAKALSIDSNTGQTIYAEMTARGKPFFIAEAGLGIYNGQYVVPPSAGTQDNTVYMNAIRQYLPNTIGFVVWCQGFDIYLQKNSSQLMNDAWAVNLGEVPAF